GAVVAKNDDERPGTQDSLLLVRLATGGEYTVRVESFKAKAGGQYELAVRRFLAVDTAAGHRTAGVIGDRFAQWHRFDAGAGLAAQIAYVPEVDASGQPREPETQVPPVAALPSDPKSPGQVVALLNVAGAYQVTVSQPLGVGVAYTFAASDPRQPLGAAPAGT